MQARRNITSSPPLPSSPPTASLQHGEGTPDTEARGVPSPAQTLWTAHPSPTQTLGHSSPELPPLSTLAGLGGFPRTPSTVARHQPTDSTYYTAIWGSPYQNPPPSFNLERAHRRDSSALQSDDVEEGDSNLQFGLEHLLPSRLNEENSSNIEFGLDHLLPSRLNEDDSPNRFNLEHLLPHRLPLETPTQANFDNPGGVTEATPRQGGFNLSGQFAAQLLSDPSNEWVRQFLAGQLNKESANWWSDESTDNESIGGKSKQAKKEVPRSQPEKRKGHKSKKDNLTLKQQDFWAHFSKEQKETLGKMMASRYADPPPHSRQVSAGSLKSRAQPSPTTAERPPPPPPPKDDKLPQSPTTFQETPLKSTPLSASPTPASPAPRLRKKAAWKGKACWISIPKDIPRGTAGYPPKPLSASEVAARMQQFERAGYDTRGFGHWPGLEHYATDEPVAQNRGIYPDVEDYLQERMDVPLRVRVPNKADWDAYVNYLTEQKLAALGVSLGGEEEQTPMSRQASSQHPGLPFSPPPPTSSAGSHRLARPGSVYSFPLGPSPGHASRQSIASPISPFGNPRPGMHMHRHSTFSTPSNFIQQQPSPGPNWSPGHYFGVQGARGGSPALPLSRPDLAEIISPSSPFGTGQGQQFPFPTRKEESLVQMQQQQQQQLQLQLLQQQQQQLLNARPTSTLAEVPEDEGEEDEPMPMPMQQASKPAPEIVVPTPRHRHNISENLEREALDAEYHLEQSIDKQFGEGGEFSTEPEMQHIKSPNPANGSGWESALPMQQVLHQPQPHNRAHSLTKPQRPPPFAFGMQPTDSQHDLSDEAKSNESGFTNPSDEHTHDATNDSSKHSKTTSQASNGWRDSRFGFGHSKHTSSSSISKLNVQAKEFKFNPSASFSPSTMSFNFSQGPGSASQSNRNSLDGLGSSFNVSAPAFKPDAPAFKPSAPAFKPTVPEFKPSGPEFKPSAPEFKPDVPAFKPAAAMNGSAFPTSSFDFNSKGPSFKPDVPALNPPVTTPSQRSSSRIFGDINLDENDIVKPARRSKAIPIIRPDNTPPRNSQEPEDREDEEGRIMQAEGREKRARMNHADGDSVPQFAEPHVLPTQPLGETKENKLGKQDPQIEKDAVPEDKENLSPDVSRAASKSKSPEPLSTFGLQKADASSKPDVEHTDIESGNLSDKTETEERGPQESEEATPSVEKPELTFTKKHKSSLSATAKPFEFRPQVGSGFDFGIHVTKPSASQNEGLDNSHISPPRHVSRSPATTFRPSDDGSYKTALESRRHAPSQYARSESVDFDQFMQPTFEQIDDVMKQMDEAGSDFGVERDDDWEQSSPRRSVHEFQRNDLKPTLKLRSDAPSPSPRRLYAQDVRGVPASSTSITHDPFSDSRAGLAYESPVHRLNNAEEIPVSDWDEGLSSEGEAKIQMRSRFFDSHVDDLLGRLLQNRLGPLERNLEHIQESIAMISQPAARGRHGLSANDRSDSDADDEDDELGADVHYRNRSPRKDRKLEKIRSIVRDALEAHQPQVASLPVPVPEPVLPEKIRDVVLEALASHQPQAPSAPVPEAVLPEQIRAIVTEALAAHQPAAAPATAPQPPVQAEDIRAIVAEALTAHQPQAAQLRSDDVRSVVAEALASQPPPAEPLLHEDIRSIVMHALASHKPDLPAAPGADPLQPDTIRSIVTEALASHKPLAPEADAFPPQQVMSEFYQALGNLKASIAQSASSHIQAEDFREMIEEALQRQSSEIAQRRASQDAEERDVRIADLETMFKEATLRVDAEVEARKAIEAREIETQRLLSVTEEELALIKVAAHDDENKVRALKVEQEDARLQIAAYRSAETELRSQLADLAAENEELRLKAVAFETSDDDVKKKLSAVTAENEALQFTLEEYRLSSNKWRDEVQQANDENDKFKKSIDMARLQAEETTRTREALRAKFEDLQHKMTVAAGQAAAERAQWQRSDEEHMKKYEVLTARVEAEARTRERLEKELERLEGQEREGMKLRVALEQTQKANARLEETVNTLNRETTEAQRTAEKYERDYQEAREAARIEVKRTRTLMEADIDAANNQVNIVRAEMESEMSRVRTELDSVRMDADTAKAKHELLLEEAADAKKQALNEALQARNLALQEQQQAFERRLDILSQEHARALEIALEDKERAEAYHKDRLSLADAKLEHLQDKVSHLEERLSVAKDAAQAAARAAQTAKGLPQTSTYTPTGPERINPQALRESIAVLQEQLQDREMQIETLNSKLASVDPDAPAKLKERDTEIAWLRELLGVRIDDLGDLINALAGPTFDREAVRDAAIRIRTNLQMEQQEKERLMTGGKTFPTLASLSDYARASPKAVQIAAAFGNWRKGRGQASSALAGGSDSSGSSRTQTPSRINPPPSTQGFLSGLMTPPTSNLRRTPQAPASSGRPTGPLRSNSSSTFNGSEAGFPGLGKQAVPRTPPLLKRAAYDQDAEMERFSESGFYDDESTVGGPLEGDEEGDTTPTGGITFGRELHS